MVEFLCFLRQQTEKELDLKIVISFVAVMMLMAFGACGGSQKHNYPWPQEQNDTYIEEYGCLEATAVVSKSLSWPVLNYQAYEDRPDIQRYIVSDPEDSLHVGLRKMLSNGDWIPVALVEIEGSPPTQYISYEGLVMMKNTQGEPSVADVVDATSGKYYCNWVE